MIESSPDDKRNVYGKSNKTFTTDLNALFSIGSVEPKRTIDIVLELAEKAGLNYTQLAGKLDTSTQNLNNWKERGMPARYNLKAAQRFGVDIRVILGIETDPSKLSQLEPWIAEYLSLDDGQRQQIREIAEDRMARFRSLTAPKRKRKRKATTEKIRKERKHAQ